MGPVGPIVPILLLARVDLILRHVFDAPGEALAQVSGALQAAFEGRLLGFIDDLAATGLELLDLLAIMDQVETCHEMGVVGSG